MEGSTHQLIDIQDIKENIAILKSGGLRMVLMVSSINFALKSPDEQQAVINRFQDFINSLDYTMQIVMQSRQLDISEYISFLKDQAEKQTNELLKIQTSEYAGFIEELIKLSNIMSKYFYVVVPLGVSLINLKSGGGFFSKLFSKSSTTPINQRDLDFEAKKNELLGRVNQITTLLGTMGLRVIPLEREQLIELLYTSYNPGIYLKQKNLEQLIATGDEAKKTEE